MRKAWMILGVLVSMVLITGTGVYAQTGEQKEAEKKDYVVGKVGEVKIYNSEIEKAAQNLNRFLRENYQKSKEWRLNFIRNYIAQIALGKRAEREGLDKSKEVVEEMERVKKSILAEKMLQKAINEKLKVTEENLKKFYEENKASYRINEKLKLSYVKEKSKKSLERVIRLLEKGKNFKTAAGKKRVEISPWVSKGGYIAPEFEAFLSGGILDILAALKEGANSEILEINNEFYVFYIDGKEPAKDKPFEGIRNEVEFQYVTKEKERIVTELVMDTFRQEKVEIYEE